MHNDVNEIAINQSAGRKPLEPQLFYTPAEVATYFGLSEPTLAKWRCRKQGPSFMKVGQPSVPTTAREIRHPKSKHPACAQGHHKNER